MELRHDITLFPNGKEKAFTLSYDDGVIQDKHFIELLKKYHLKATFNLNSGTFGDVDHYQHLVVDHVKVNQEEVKELYKGYEVAVHTITHPDLPKIPSSMVSYEVSGDKHNLEEIVGYPVRGMAYPFGTYNDRVVEVLKNAGIEYSRTVKSTHHFSLPENFLVWNPTCHHDDKELMALADQFLALTRASASIFYVWGHTYEFDNNNNWDTIEKLFEKISGKDNIWYATNIEIVDYLNAVKQLKYSADGKMIYNPTDKEVWLRIFRKDYKVGSGETVHIQM
jgi:peptidoglycan/xylan/chitin deacetylase (PgdA/CDA1 family)